MRESSYTQLIIRINTNLNHIDTRVILLGYEVLGWYKDPYNIGIKEYNIVNKTSLNTHIIFVHIYIKCKSLITIHEYYKKKAILIQHVFELWLKSKHLSTYPTTSMNKEDQLLVTVELVELEK